MKAGNQALVFGAIFRLVSLNQKNNHTIRGQKMLILAAKSRCDTLSTPGMLH